MNSKAENEVNRIIDGLISEKKRLTEAIKELDEKIEEDSKAMSKATGDADLKAYKEAKAAKDDHEILREMNKQKLKKISNNPAPSAEEIKRLIKEMESDFVRQNAALQKETVRVGESLFTSAYENRRMHDRLEVIRSIAKKEFNVDSANAIGEEGMVWQWAESLVSSNRYQHVTGKNKFTLTDELNEKSGN